MLGHHVLDAWLGEKGKLYTKESLFRCDDACPRYGCREELLVTVTFLELKAQARHLSLPALEVFDRYCSTVPFVEHGLEAVRVRFVLRKPCLFLNDAGYCAIYAVRPAACALFPEFLSLDAGVDSCRQSGGNLPSEHGEREGEAPAALLLEGATRAPMTDLSRYPCIEHFAEVPEARKDVLTALMSIHRKEVYAGEIYLFGRAGFAIDLREEVSRRYDGCKGGAVPFSIQTDALHAALSAGGWWDRIREKFEALDTPDGLATLLSGMKIVETLNL